MTKATIVATASLAVALSKLDAGVEVEVFRMDDSDPVPDFKEVRTDPVYRREKTHPASYRKGHK